MSRSGSRAALPATALAGAALSTVVLLAASGMSAAQGCDETTFEGAPFTVCTAVPGEGLRLWHADSDGVPWGAFSRLDAALRAKGQRLAFAMNAGMFHPNRQPVGLYVEDGIEAARLVTRAGPGNFGLLPNGVFCLRDARAVIVESRRFANLGLPCDHATQSGPLLVIGGQLHPRFLPESTSRHVRNGVGVRPDGTVVLAISNAPVTFHRFARFFRDVLGTPDALYLDGSVSRLYAPGAGRRDAGFRLGPIIGVVEETP